MAVGGVASMGIMATIVNVFGAIKNNRSTVPAIVGSFIVTFFLLALAETKASRVAVAFMLAFLVSSIAANNNEILTFVAETTDKSRKLEPLDKVSQNQSSGTGGRMLVR